MLFGADIDFHLATEGVDITIRKMFIKHLINFIAYKCNCYKYAGYKYAGNMVRDF